MDMWYACDVGRLMGAVCGMMVIDDRGSTYGAGALLMLGWFFRPSLNRFLGGRGCFSR